MILFISNFSWFYVFSFNVPQNFLGSSSENLIIVTTAFNFVIVLTLLLTRFFIHKFNEIRIICGCSIIVSILTIALLSTSSIILRSIFFLVAGMFFSICQLGSFVYFWNLTVPEERGRVGGIVGFFSLPIVYLITSIAGILDFSEIVLLSIILSSGILVIKLLNPETKEIVTAETKEKGYQPEKRTILLYSIPWVVFSVINATLARDISFFFSMQLPSSFYISLTISQSLGAIFGALIGGIIADLFGRRLALTFSLTLFGISSALAGLVKSYELLYFVYIANGVNWGILLTLYSWVIWGDLANKKNCFKIYSIGMIIYYFAIGVGILMDQIPPISLLVSSLLSCLLIFLSNTPLLLAPELLSSDFRERIKLKLHMNVLKKIGRKLSQNHG